MKRILTCALAFTALAIAHASRAQPPDPLRTMFDSNQLFDLRDAVAHTHAPLLFRGAVEVSANHRRTSQKLLHKVIRAAPHSSDAYDAHGLLGNIYFRNGLYRESFRELQTQAAERPNAEDVKNALPLVQALSGYPDLKVVNRKHSILARTASSLPVRINGLDASYIFDTGASISAISDNEAARFGLTPQAIDTKLTEASGAGLTGLRVAVAHDLVIGNLHLRNVAFIVLSDDHEPFVELPQDKRGILGLPVLIAMQTLRWQPNGPFEFAFAPAPPDLPASNLLFHNNTAVVRISSQSKPLDFTLDTGARDTDLNPAFARAFPDLIKSSGQPEQHSVTGMGGTNTYDSVLLPSIDFQIGGREVTLKPAHVFLTHGLSEWAVGNLGNDLLHQAHTITLDFRAMTLRLE
jgi:predicted aspartyl protease